jgi:uncharacterized cupredoxin-like copper-binding protein
MIVLVAACSSSSKSKASPSSAASASAKVAPAKATVAPIPHVNRVIVTETEYKLKLDVTRFKPASYTFTLRNPGKMRHALEINGPGLIKQTSATISPGQTTDLIVPLVKGTYELWCPVGNHKALGMDLHITVS